MLEQCLPRALGHEIAFVLGKKEFTSENFKNDWFQEVGKLKNEYAADDYTAELAAAADMMH